VTLDVAELGREGCLIERGGDKRDRDTRVAAFEREQAFDCIAPPRIDGESV
jgi:hypothetical protein